MKVAHISFRRPHVDQKQTPGAHARLEMPTTTSTQESERVGLWRLEWMVFSRHFYQMYTVILVSALHHLQLQVNRSEQCSMPCKGPCYVFRIQTRKGVHQGQRRVLLSTLCTHMCE